MEKLTKLTPEQEKIMYEVRDEWLNRFFSLGKIDEKACTEGIHMLYEWAGLPKPVVIYAKSPLDCQDLLNKNRSQPMYHATSWYGNVSDYGWVAYYDFFRRIGIVKNEKFNSYVEFLKSNIYDCIQMSDVCVVSPMPEFIHVDEQRRLHSLDGPAIGWSDGFEQYYLFGRFFKEDLYKKIMSDNVTFADVMKIGNIEQRMAALKVLDPDKLLKGTDAELIDESKRGNMLYKIPARAGVFSDDAYFLRYSCPSTGRVYISGVDRSVGEKGVADDAMAWKFTIDPKLYDKLELES